MSIKWELFTLRVVVMMVVVVLVTITATSGRTINVVRQLQRSDDSLDSHDDGDDTFALYNRPPNYSQLSSMHTANKRSTIILDKIVYALQNALNKDEAERGGGGGRNGVAVGGVAGGGGGAGYSGHPPLSAEDLGPLQHRLPRDKVFWRCYFNAVSCFRRK